MSELYDSIDYSNLNFEYVGSTNDVSFYEYKDSKEIFNMIKSNQIKFNEVKFLKKLNEVKIGKKTIEQKQKRLITLKNFINLEKRLSTF